MFLGPWPHREMWWCACVLNDCQASLYGPFSSLEEANFEAKGDCYNPHIALRGEPDLNSNVRVAAPCISSVNYDFVASDSWRIWFLENRQRQSKLAMFPGNIEEECRRVYESR